MAKKTENTEEIGKRIFDFFVRKGLTAAGVARAVGVKQPTLSGVTRGKHAPGVPLLVYLAGQGADLNYLLTGRAAAETMADTALASVVGDWPELTIAERMALANQASAQAAANRAKKDRRQFIS